jgi:two-component system response regulator AtoC
MAPRAGGNGNQAMAAAVAASSGNSFDLTALLEQTEKDLIVRTLAATGGAQAEAARRMGLSRSALGYKLNKYGIKNSDEQ